jgi:hypothetical protein
MPVRAADEWDTDRLLHRAQAGQGPALGQLLELFRGYLILQARLQIDRRLRGKVDAVDLVQDKFLEAYAGPRPVGGSPCVARARGSLTRGSA